MILSDTTNRENGLIQRCEDNCGLGATGISGNSELLSMFVGWLNQWNGMAAYYAIQAWHGHDFDDKSYTTLPSGFFTGVTTADYNFDDSYKMLKVKRVKIYRDGVNGVEASAVDDTELSTNPYSYDLTSQGFKLTTPFTSAEVAAGAKIWVEWFRMPRAFATSGTNTYQPCLDFQFHHFPAVGASYEYCRLYKPEKVGDLKLELCGDARQKGLIKEVQEWYMSKQPSNRRMKPMLQSNK